MEIQMPTSNSILDSWRAPKEGGLSAAGLSGAALNQRICSVRLHPVVDDSLGGVYLVAPFLPDPAGSW